MTRVLRRIDWFEAIYWSIIALCVLGAMVGCGGCEQRPDEQPSPAPAMPRAVMPEGVQPGDRVIFEYESDGGTFRRSDSASGTGPGLSTTSDEAAAKFSTTTPQVGINGTTGIGGGGSTEFSLRTVAGAARNPLLWVGIVAVVAGLACFYMSLRRAGTYLVLGGAGFIVAAMLPGWAWAIIAAVGLAGAGVYLWSEWDAKRLGRTAKAVVAGVDDLKRMDPVTYERAKAAVATHARSIENGTITQIKRKIAKERV